MDSAVADAVINSGGGAFATASVRENCAIRARPQPAKHGFGSSDRHDEGGTRSL